MEERDEGMKGAMDRWSNGSREQWIKGAMEQWIKGAMDQGSNGSREQWIKGAMEQWIKGAMDQGEISLKNTLHHVVTQVTMFENSITKSGDKRVFKSFTSWISLISNLKRCKYLIFAPGFGTQRVSVVLETMKENNKRDRNNKEI